MYTDGVTESMSSDNVHFSEEKLLEVLSQSKDKTLSNIVINVRAAVEKHAVGTMQPDNITMFILKYKWIG